MHNQTPVYVFFFCLFCFCFVLVFCFVFFLGGGVVFCLLLLFFNSLFIQPLDLQDHITNKHLHVTCSPSGVGWG